MSEYQGPTTLELMLVETGKRVTFPPDRDLLAAVLARIELEGAGVRRRSWSWSPRAALAFALALVALITGGLVLFPDARRAVADFLGISGIEIRVPRNAPEPTQVPSAKPRLELGREVTLATAQSRVSFDVLVPTASGLPEPRVFLDKASFDGAVSFVYRPGPELPQTQETGVGLLVTQFRAGLEENLIKKVSTEASSVIPLGFADLSYWIEGAPHTILFLDADGDINPDRIRLAGNTLVWEKDGVSYRLESALERHEALGIARSMD